jgi:hypothetical protein
MKKPNIPSNTSIKNTEESTRSHFEIANSPIPIDENAQGTMNLPSIHGPGMEILDTSQKEHSTMDVLRNSVVKKRVLLDEKETHLLICKGDDKMFKFQLTQLCMTDENEMIVLAEEELKFQELKWLMHQFEYRDVMPVTFDKKHLRGSSDFAKYLLMPFVTAEKNPESGRKEIKISAKARGILNGLHKVEFLDRSCFLTFHHIRGNVFRIVLTETGNSGEEVLRIDMEFDKYQDYFEKVSIKRPDEESQTELFIKLIEGFEDYADEDQVNEATDIMRRLANPERYDEIELDSYRQIQDAFTPKLKDILKEVEEYLASKGLSNFAKVTEDKVVKYYKLTASPEMKKITFHYLYDNPSTSSVIINLKNLHETWAPEKKKVKASGHSQYVYQSIWKHFGLLCTRLSPSEKLATLHMLSDTFTLHVFERALQPEESERYHENPMLGVPIEIAAFNRTYLGKKVQFPLTLSLVGIKGKPLGIKAAVFNATDVTEYGAFIHIDPPHWDKKIEDRKKRRSERVDPLPMIENYHLEYLLKRIGWDIIKTSLMLDITQKKVEITGIKNSRATCWTDQLENVISTDTILKYYREKSEE